MLSRMAVRPATTDVPHRTLLLRHGETVWNEERRFTTRSDIPLSERGVEQAERLARNLAGASIDRIVSSPLQRARVTAEIVARALPREVPLTVDPRLTEIDAGPFEGLTPEEAEEGALADAYERWHTDEEPEFPEGAETFESALARGAAALAEVAALPGTTLVSTHGSLARLLIAAVVIGAPPGRHRRLWLDNARFAIVEWSSGGKPRLTGFNLDRMPGDGS
jgi:broad specificity phosphatase PhoE